MMWPRQHDKHCTCFKTSLYHTSSSFRCYSATQTSLFRLLVMWRWFTYRWVISNWLSYQPHISTWPVASCWYEGQRAEMSANMKLLMQSIYFCRQDHLNNIQWKAPEPSCMIRDFGTPCWRIRLWYDDSAIHLFISALILTCAQACILMPKWSCLNIKHYITGLAWWEVTVEPRHFWWSTGAFDVAYICVIL